MAPISFEYSKSAQTSFKPPLIANENAFLGDVFTSESNDPQAPISAGFYRLEKGKPKPIQSHASEDKKRSPKPRTMMTDRTISSLLGTPLVYEYTYHEMKIIVDGSFDISDETGKKVHATKGDVFYFPKGSKITFETDDFGLGFFVGQRKEGGA